MYSTNGTTCSLAKRALGMMGEEVPRRILSSVPNWKNCEVQTWLQQVGFSAYCTRFQVGWVALFTERQQLYVVMLCWMIYSTLESWSYMAFLYSHWKELHVDGDLLLNITEQDLCSDLGMTAGLTRKRFVVKRTTTTSQKQSVVRLLLPFSYLAQAFIWSDLLFVLSHHKSKCKWFSWASGRKCFIRSRVFSFRRNCAINFSTSPLLWNVIERCGGPYVWGPSFWLSRHGWLLSIYIHPMLCSSKHARSSGLKRWLNIIYTKN